jgi:hypothetical protein
VEIIACENTRPTERSKFAYRRASCAKDFTTRTPPMSSSAFAVSSAIRCWTSCSAGRDRRP